MSKLEPLQYYKWKWQDWRLSRRVQRMHYIARGFYRELLDEQWAEGSIPHDIEGLAEICGCPKAVMSEYWTEIEPCFDEREDGRLVNAKLETLRTELDAKRIKAVEAGRAGAAAKPKKSQAKLANAQRTLALPSERQYRERREETEERRGEERESALARAVEEPPSQPALPAPQKPSPFARSYAQEPAEVDPQPEAFGDADEVVCAIVCAHPRSLLRSLRWNEVRQRDKTAVIEAIVAEVQATGCTESEAAAGLLAITKTFADKVPRGEWKFLKPVDEFYANREYRRDPVEFTHTKTKPAEEATHGDITDETIRQARERRTGDGPRPE